MWTGVAMTDGMGAGARAERMRRRKFWGVIGGLAAGGAITGTDRLNVQVSVYVVNRGAPS